MKNYFFLLSTLLLHTSQITVIGKSNLERCTEDSKGLSSCKEKIVLALVIQNAELENTDYLETTLSEITDTNGEKKKLKSSMKITISKSPVIANYPCIYLQDFNYQPKEKIIKSDVFTCEDGDLAESPTCPWELDSQGQKIPHSQGFCCKCSAGQIIGGSSNSIRGNTCKILNLGIGSSTAHCLIYDNLWFSAYEIQQYQLEYKITMNITSSNSDIITSLTLSQSDTFVKSEDGNVYLKLVGDFLPNNQLPNDYSNSYLLVPSKPETHIMVVESILNYMIVKSSMFSLDGKECDKIGTGYYAFRTQGGSDRCEIKVGSCLNNQISDLYKRDLEKISKGETPTYLISQTGKQFNFFNTEGGNKKFSFTLSGNINSMITVELNADEISFVTNVSDGVIDKVIVSDFEAMSNNGRMVVQITNTGSITAAYYLVYNCNENIMPVTSDEVSLNSLQTKTISKFLYTISSNSQANECKVILKNAIGEKIDEKIIQFNTTEQVSKNNQSNNDKNNNYEEEEVNNELTCSDYCSSFFSLGCFINHKCWWYFFKTILIFTIIGIIFFILLKCGIIQCICRCLKKIIIKKKKGKLEQEKQISTINGNIFEKRIYLTPPKLASSSSKSYQKLKKINIFE